MAPTLDPDAQAVLDAMAASGEPHLSTLSVEEARKRVRAVLVSRRPPLPLPKVEDVSVPAPGGALRVRLYRPREGRLPVVLFIHGGGWTVNDVDTHDDLCRRLAKRSGWLFASVDYRKAPEHKHPAALEDALLAYRWLLDNAESIGCDASRTALVGESSGAMIAASLTVLLRDLGAPLPGHQVLAYPVTDSFDRWPSYTERGSGYILDRALLRWYFDHFLPNGSTDGQPYLVPLATEDLSGLPRALVLTAEFDPLRDEGVAYAKRLAEAGVDVDHVHAPDQMHGFLLLGRAIPGAGALVDRLADWLSRAAAPARTA
jgi:acetyl esterase